MAPPDPSPSGGTSQVPLVARLATPQEVDVRAASTGIPTAKAAVSNPLTLPSPTRGEGSNVAQPSPTRGEGSNVARPSLTRGEGSNVAQPSPTSGDASNPQSPIRNPKSPVARPIPVAVRKGTLPVVRAPQEDDEGTEAEEDLAKLALRNAPPWLVSTVVHMLLLIVLAVWFLPARVRSTVDLNLVYSDRLGDQLDDESVTVGAKNPTPNAKEQIVTPDDLKPVDDPFAAPPDLAITLDGNAASSQLAAPLDRHRTVGPRARQPRGPAGGLRRQQVERGLRDLGPGMARAAAKARRLVESHRPVPGRRPR